MHDPAVLSVSGHLLRIDQILHAGPLDQMPTITMGLTRPEGFPLAIAYAVGASSVMVLAFATEGERDAMLVSIRNAMTDWVAWSRSNPR